MTVLKGNIFAFICIQIDNINLDNFYMWASLLKKNYNFSAASTEGLFKIYLITNITK